MSKNFLSLVSLIFVFLARCEFHLYFFFRPNTIKVKLMTAELISYHTLHFTQGHPNIGCWILEHVRKQFSGAYHFDFSESWAQPISTGNIVVNRKA